MPDLHLETESGGIVAGIDEVGRGPWAGPVVAAAVVIDTSRLPSELESIINDSKKLSPAKRSEIALQLPDCARIGLGAATPAEIGDLNILGATFRAMERAVIALGVIPDMALVDGNRLPPLPCPARTVVRGDSISLSIAAASIVAKVTRDRLMARLGARYPGFGWERNAGYGTAEHRDALKRLGVTPHHRKSFAPILKMLSPD
ncbi:MAG: ribonuclease HII [Rhodospirillaceae bacterium]|jgi:ribonuclease HII|nr:ribonuclease HII [Rhodospirillaceae bacterium]MBT5457537.1 ribonuclease HII [Rhodospirillaceae bacterium]